MSMKRSLLVLHAIPLTALLCVATAYADCVDRMREPTAAELDFHRRAIAVLIAALPPAPTGAVIDGVAQDTRPPAIGVLCGGKDGHKIGDLDLNVSQGYIVRSRDAQSEAQKQHLHKQRGLIDDEMHALLKLPADKAAERDALERKSAATETARQAAMKAGDKATAAARLAEIDSLNEAARAIRNQHQAAVQPQVQALQERRKAFTVEDQFARVRLALNVVKLPSGGATNPQGALGSASPARSASFKVVNLVWSVEGPETPLRQTLARAIDQGWLTSLIGKAPPTPEESQAVAKAATPATPATPLPASRPATAAATPAAASTPPPGSTASAALAIPPPTNLIEPAKAVVDTAQKLRSLFGR